MSIEKLVNVLKDIEIMRGNILGAGSPYLGTLYKLDELKAEVEKVLGVRLLRQHLEAEG